MKKKKDDHSNYLKHLRVTHAEIIKDVNPNVNKITYEIEYFDGDTNKLISNKIFYKTSDMKALFDFDCLAWECVDGGYDFTSIIKSSLREGLKEVSGSSICNGWQDKERVGKHRCLMKVKYKVIITYSEEL